MALVTAFPSVVGTAVYPVERAVSLFDRCVWSRFAGLVSGASVSAENIRLRREVQALSLLRGDCERLCAENARLRRVLDFRARSPGTWVAAAVLSAGGGAAAAHRTIRIDKGSQAGLREGAVVVAADGLVGRVSSVAARTAEVLLVTDPALKVSCAVETERGEEAFGILAGDGSDRLVLDFVRCEGKLRTGSTVRTSGLGGVFPRGLAVGTLLPAPKGARDGIGEVLPRVDLSTLEDVFIRCDQ